MAEDFNPALPADQTQGAADDKTPETQQPPLDSTPDETPPPNAPNETEPEAAQMAKINKTKAMLEEENAILLAEHRELTSQLQTLRRMIPNYINPREGYKVVFIKSDRVPAVPRNGKKYLEGSVNGKKFEVLCDVQTEVPNDVAEALAGVIRNQS